MLKTIEQKVLMFIDENHLIEKGDKLLVAFSGGADSVFLLYLLIKYKRRFGIEIAAFHLNHKLRGKDADKDEKFCSDFCIKNNIQFKSVSKDVKQISRFKKVSIEEAARELRYKELSNTSEKIKADKIATAHNLSDNVETFLLNLVKGTGLKGLTGIPIQRRNIIRPILCLTSEEIRAYLKSNKISYRFDKSNFNTDYERNFLRHEIIPRLKKQLNPQFEEKIGNTSRILKDVNLFIDRQVNLFSKSAVDIGGKRLTIHLKKLKSKDEIFNSIFLKTIIEKNFIVDIDAENVHSLIELINSQTGKSIHLKENFIAIRERDSIVIEKNKAKNKEVRKKIKIGQKVKFDGKEISIEPIEKKKQKFSSNKFIEYISGDLVNETFEIRKWRNGDRFIPLGMKGSKKISDFLADEKISTQMKKESLVLTNSGKIVWAIGLRIDERFKVLQGTNRILKLTASGF
ncbi:MAG: tRNA lysidine(34) synthetase TilS [Ignavibacteriaceae bacterium]